MRSGSYGLAWKLVAAVNLAAGLLIAYAGEYLATGLLPGHPYTPSFANFLTLLGTYLAISFGALFLPMGIWKLRERKAAS